MARGGARANAGRKRNTPNKATAAREARIAASGVTPLDYMLQVMRDTTADKTRRDDMAKSAAPYVHPKFSAITPQAPPGQNGYADLSKLTDDELEAVERISRKLAASFGSAGGEETAGD
jgi:hypothetical protein